MRVLTQMVVGLAALLAFDGTLAAQTSAEVEDLKRQVESLSLEVARLREAADAPWLSEARAEAIRSVVEEVLADADTRDSLLQSTLTAGYDQGFFLRSEDGAFALRLAGELQFRFMANHQDEAPSGDDDRWGFETSRTRLQFSGHVVDPRWVYMVKGDFDRDGGGFTLLDAYIGRAFEGGWTFLAGQFRVPMLREFLVVETQQLAVERSLVHQEFTAGRTQGIAADYRGDWLHVTAGFTDGHPATGGFNQPALDRDTEYAFTLRGEALLAGGWDQFADFTSFPGEETAFMLGAATHYQVSEYGTIDDELEVFQWTLDGSAEFGGWNLFGAFVGRHIDATGLSLDQFGFVAQGGLFLNDDWELFGRYEWGDDDSDGEDLHLVTIGANRYFARQGVKWTADVGFGLEEVGSTWGDGFLGSGGDPAGWRTDAAGSDGQIVFRTQMQLLF
jgi:hypothetical protein